MTKGRKGEREVAQLVQAWWQPHESGIEFAATPRSGGWRQSMPIRADMKLAGDIITNARSWPFTVEVKRRENWAEKNLRIGIRSPVWKWWRQTQRDASEENGIPMLWFRHNRRPWYVMLPVDYVYSRQLHLELRAEMAWQPDRIAKIDIGTQFPVVYMADDILALDPSFFADQPKEPR